MAKVSLSPFELSEDDIRLMAGELTVQEMRAVKAVLNGVKRSFINGNPNNGMTHADNCWAWGPAHYPCAYEKVVAMSREHPPMTTLDIGKISERLQLHYEDVERVTRAVEAFHHIGAVR